MNELFRIAGKHGDWHYDFTVSLIEIYNEQVHDLLGSKPKESLNIRQGTEGNFVEGLTWLQVEDIKKMNEVECIVTYNTYYLFLL